MCFPKISLNVKYHKYNSRPILIVVMPRLAIRAELQKSAYTLKSLGERSHMGTCTSFPTYRPLLRPLPKHY